VPGRLPEAITHFEAALRIKPGDAQTERNLAAARRMLEALPASAR
jgi:hypothetical protein